MYGLSVCNVVLAWKLETAGPRRADRIRTVIHSATLVPPISGAHIVLHGQSTQGRKGTSLEV